MALTNLQFNKRDWNQINERELFLRKRFLNDMKNKLEMEVNEEIEYIEKAIAEFNNCKEIIICCPRCGKKLVYERNNTCYNVKCEREKCVNIKYRKM